MRTLQTIQWKGKRGEFGLRRLGGGPRGPRDRRLSGGRHRPAALRTGHRAGLPLTTAHRLVRQLAGHGLLETGSGGSVRLGLRLWELVNRNSPTLALRQAAMPFMEDIQQVLNQNVNLAVLDGWEALFVERLSRRGSVANRAQIAGRMPVHVSSAGLALMATPAARRSRRSTWTASRIPPERLTADDLRALLGEAAHQGYAQLAGVVDPDTWGIAVPVMDAQERTVAALGVVVPLREVRLQALVPALQTAARGIARRLGESRDAAEARYCHRFRSTEFV